MAIRLSTAGVKVQYVVEATAGVKPTTGYIIIPEIKEVPEMNPEPSTIETTTLAETEYKTYVDGLKDLGGALAFTINLTDAFKTIWDTLVASYVTAKAAGKSVWFNVEIPGITQSVFFTGNPSALGVPSMGVGNAIESKIYITPTSAPAWATKVTSVSV